MVQKQKVISDNFTILQESQKTEYLSCINENLLLFWPVFVWNIGTMHGEQ